MKTNYTPGPWRAAVSPSKDLVIQQIDANRLFPPMVATVSNWRDDSAEVQAEAKANANLIAAAPDLLAALERLLVCPDLCLDSLEQNTLAGIETARLAIARTKGA